MPSAMQTLAATKPLSSQSGFTLVELVAAIILIGILAVVVAPRFSGVGTFSEYALRDQLISALRLAQQRAMYDHQAQSCYRLLIEADQFGPQRSVDGGATFAYFGPGSLANGAASQHKITPPMTVTATAVYFDGLGNAMPQSAIPCAGSPGNTAIAISNDVTLHACVLSTGFVEKFACP